jgi:hypothetical protein
MQDGSFLPKDRLHKTSYTPTDPCNTRCRAAIGQSDLQDCGLARIDGARRTALERHRCPKGGMRRWCQGQQTQQRKNARTHQFHVLPDTHSAISFVIAPYTRAPRFQLSGCVDCRAGR